MKSPGSVAPLHHHECTLSVPQRSFVSQKSRIAHPTMSQPSLSQAFSYAFMHNITIEPLYPFTSDSAPCQATLLKSSLLAGQGVQVAGDTEYVYPFNSEAEIMLVSKERGKGREASWCSAGAKQYRRCA